MGQQAPPLNPSRSHIVDFCLMNRLTNNAIMP